MARPNVKATWDGERIELTSPSGVIDLPYGGKFFGLDRVSSALKRRGFRIVRTGHQGLRYAVPTTMDARARCTKEFTIGAPVLCVY